MNLYLAYKFVIMGTYKILLEDSIGYDFTLIALHGSLEPFYLAFILNRHLDLRLSRTSQDLEVNHGEFKASYPCYNYNHHYQYIDYQVFANKTKAILHPLTNEGLFDKEETTRINHFLPELPQVDYFIKVVEDGNAFAKAKTIKTLNQIPQIVTAYEIDISSLKNKQNLIFE